MKNFHVRRGTHWMAMSLFLAVAGCGGDSGTNGGGGGGGGGGGTTLVVTTSVNVVDFDFTPPAIQVSPGATVTWTWTGSAGSAPHNVTFASITVSDPSNTQTTGTFQAEMPIATGTYNYQCTIHPSQMNGTVTVQ